MGIVSSAFQQQSKLEKGNAEQREVCRVMGLQYCRNTHDWCQDMANQSAPCQPRDKPEIAAQRYQMYDCSYQDLENSKVESIKCAGGDGDDAASLR